MTQEERIQKIKMVAGFMDIKVIEWKPRNYTRLILANSDGNFDYESIEDYTPDTDWNQLMLVVEKIESLGYYTNILSADNNNKKHTMHITLLGEDEMYTFWHDNKINAVWLAVVEFINTQTPSHDTNTKG